MQFEGRVVAVRELASHINNPVKSIVKLSKFQSGSFVDLTADQGEIYIEGQYKIGTKFLVELKEVKS